MNNRWKKEFNKLILKLGDEKEAEELFGELLTPREYEELILRWQIAKFLIRGTSQKKIRETLKVSRATITRGSKEIKYGKGAFHKFYLRLNKS